MPDNIIAWRLKVRACLDDQRLNLGWSAIREVADGSAQLANKLPSHSSKPDQNRDVGQGVGSTKIMTDPV